MSREASQIRIVFVLLGGVLLAMAIPPAAFFLTGLTKGMGVGGALSVLVEQYSTERQNLWMISVLGVFPFVLLTIPLAGYRRIKGPAGLAPMALAGTIAIAAVLVWANLTYWSSYLPSRQFLMWPHGLELVIGPLFFAPVAMLAGVVLGWLVHRSTAGTQA